MNSPLWREFHGVVTLCPPAESWLEMPLPSLPILMGFSTFLFIGCIILQTIWKQHAFWHSLENLHSWMCPKNIFLSEAKRLFFYEGYWEDGDEREVRILLGFFSRSTLFQKDIFLFSLVLSVVYQIQIQNQWFPCHDILSDTKWGHHSSLSQYITSQHLRWHLQRSYH